MCGVCEVVWGNVVVPRCQKWSFGRRLAEIIVRALRFCRNDGACPWAYFPNFICLSIVFFSCSLPHLALLISSRFSWLLPFLSSFASSSFPPLSPSSSSSSSNSSLLLHCCSSLSSAHLSFHFAMYVVVLHFLRLIWVFLSACFPIPYLCR